MLSKLVALSLLLVLLLQVDGIVRLLSICGMSLLVLQTLFVIRDVVSVVCVFNVFLTLKKVCVLVIFCCCCCFCCCQR